MKIGARFFKGEQPRLSARNLPDGAAQAAVNARVLSTDLTAWQRALLKEAITSAYGTPQALYLMQTRLAGADVFLRWPTDVNVARGPIAGDTTERLYFTGAPDDPDDPNSARRPKVTNFEKAAQDSPRSGLTSGQYPHDWLLLGVPAPTQAPSIDSGPSTTFTVLSDGTSLTGWTTSGSVTADADDPARSGHEHAIKVEPGAYLYRDLGTLDESLSGLQFQFQGGESPPSAAAAGVDIRFGCNATGAGLALRLFTTISGGWTYCILGTTTTWAAAPVWDYTNLIDSAVVDFVKHLPFRIELDLFQTAALEWELTLTIVKLDPDDPEAPATIFSDTFPVGAPSGSYGGFFPPSTGNEDIYLSNIGTTVAEPFGTVTTVAYLYTFINELGEEGPPSPASAIVNFASGYDVTVSVPDPEAPDDTDYGLVLPGNKRLYRTLTDADGNVEFRKVADIAYGTTTFTDTVSELDLGVALPSTDWDLPPDDGHSMLALPNGMTLMASKNELCPSERNRPHAWPVGYRLATDFPIVGLGALDTTIVVLTQANPYLAIGSDPAALSMAKIELPYGCVAKRSIATLKGFGVVYASPDGLVAISGAGASIISEAHFTRAQWQALKPESIRAIAHDDRYLFFYDTGATQGGYVFDPRPGGFGLTTIDLVATIAGGAVGALYSDPLTDTLYFVLAGNVYAWDQGAAYLPYRWRSRLFQLPYPTSLAAACIRGENLNDADFGPLQFRLYANGVLVDERDITAEGEFVLSNHAAAGEYFFELEGAARVETVECADDMEELA